MKPAVQYHSKTVKAEKKFVSAYLSITLEDIALEAICSSVSGDIGEYLQVWAVMGHVEDAVDRVMHHLSVFNYGGGFAPEESSLLFPLSKKVYWI